MTDYELMSMIVDYGLARFDSGNFVRENLADAEKADEKSARLFLKIADEIVRRKVKASLIDIVKSGTEAQQVMADYGIESTEELGKALAFWNDQDSDRLKRLTERDEPKKVIVKETGDHIVQVRCPVCNEVLKDDGSESSFCPICGQRLDWSCEEEKENG